METHVFRRKADLTPPLLVTLETRRAALCAAETQSAAAKATPAGAKRA